MGLTDPVKRNGLRLWWAVPVGLALATSASASDLEAVQQLRLCVNGGQDDPVVQCEMAAKSGLDPANRAIAYTLLGLYLEPGIEEEEFERMTRAETSYRKALNASPQAASGLPPGPVAR